MKDKNEQGYIGIYLPKSLADEFSRAVKNGDSNKSRILRQWIEEFVDGDESNIRYQQYKKVSELQMEMLRNAKKILGVKDDGKAGRIVQLIDTILKLEEIKGNFAD